MASESGCGLYGYELNNDELVLNDTTKVKALALQGGDVKMMAGTFDTVTLDGANGRSSFEMNGGTVETVESSNGLVVLNSGTVTRATLTDSEIQVYGGSITTLRLNGDAVEPEDNSWSVTARIDGGEVDTVHATAAMIELLNGTITELYADGGDIELLGGNIAAAELEEISATENDPGVSVVLSVEGGEVENLNVTGSTVGSAAVILRSGEVTNLTQTGGEVALLGDKTDKIVGFATVYDTQVTIQGGEIGSLVSSIGWTEIQNGKFESITLDGTEASIQNGIITNGVKIIDSNPEDGNYADVFITGGTISADSASAAITVNAVVEPVDEPSPNVRIDKSSINDDITPVVIDGGDKTAILVQSGVVRVDTTGMIETSDGTEEAVESKHTKIKAKSVDDFVRVSSSEDVFAHAYTVYVDEAGEMNEVDLSNASTLYETEGEGYVLKSARESLRSLVDMAEDGDTVAIKKDMVRTEDDTPSIADISVGYDKNVEVVLDLNGHKLAIGEVYVNEGSELTIIDSQSSGLLDCDWFQNNGVMNLNAIDIDVNSIYNMGTMNIEETDITSSTGNSDEESSFYNYGVLTANGGEWSLLNEGGGSWNYGEMTLADVTVDTNHPIYSSSVSEGVSAELNIVGGKITGDADVLIESSDILNISGGAELMKNRIDSIQALLVVSGGTANIGGSGDPVVLSSTSGSGGALICNMYYGAHDVGDGVTWKSTINLENVQIDSGENSAVHLLAGHSLIVGSNVSITSESEYGAIWCDAISDDNNDYIDLGSPIKLNGGTITNSHAEAGVINQHSSDYEEIENWTSYYSTILLASDSNSMATLKSGSTSCSAKNVNELAEEGLITNSYDYDLGSGNGKTEYMTYTPSNALQTSSVSLMSLRPTQNPDAELEGDLIGGDLPEDNEDNLGGSGNDDVIGDSSDDDDDSNNTSSGNIETATGADATEKEDNTETASGGNATGNGEPMTGAPAAIPLAAALLGIWMSMPKEYKRRNRKEC